MFISFGLKSQSKQETLNYIYSVIKHECGHCFDELELRGKHLLLKKPGGLACYGIMAEYIALNGSYSVGKRTGLNLVGNKVEVYAVTKNGGDYLIWSGNNENAVVVPDYDTGRRLANAINHLIKINSDPFD